MPRPALSNMHFYMLPLGGTGFATPFLMFPLYTKAKWLR